jgi:tetratricopeptide (TPR) repeat protein
MGRNTSQVPIWNLPFRRNPFFTGREELLTRLHDQLNQTKTAALTQAQAISGMGGIGKTQTALEYAYRYREEYQAIFWVGAETRLSLLADFGEIAALLHLAEKDDQDQEVLVMAVKHWMLTHPDWLLILDNADDVQMASDFLPPGGRGHVLLTTRAQAAGALARSLQVDEMDTQEGTLLLLRRAGVLAIESPVESAEETERTTAEAIVRELGGLPLALDQAGAYIEETGCGLLDYLHLYQQRRRELLGLRKSLTAEHPEPVTTTWSLSFQKIEEANRAGSALLRVCAFLAPDAMAEEIFTGGASHLGNMLEPVATDPLKWNQTLEEVRRYSLLKRHAPTKTLSIHRLVQAVLRDKMTPQEQRQWAERAIRAVNAVFPLVELETRARCERYLPQAQVCAQLLEQYDLAFAEAARLLHLTGNYLLEHARYAEAERYYQQALQIKQKVLPAGHPSTAATWHELGRLNLRQSRYAEAERCYQQALQMYQKVLPAGHPSTIIALKSYAYLLRQMGRENEAIALETRFKAK